MMFSNGNTRTRIQPSQASARRENGLQAIIVAVITLAVCMTISAVGIRIQKWRTQEQAQHTQQIRRVKSLAKLLKQAGTLKCLAYDTRPRDSDAITVVDPSDRSGTRQIRLALSNDHANFDAIHQYLWSHSTIHTIRITGYSESPLDNDGSLPTSYLYLAPVD